MAEEEKDEQQESQKGGSKTMLFVIIGAVLFLIIVGVVVVVLMSGGASDEHSQNSGAQTESRATPAKKSTNTGDSSLMNEGPIFPIPNPAFVINLSSQGRESYLQVSVSLALSDVKLQAEVEKKIDIIKNMVIDVFSSKTPEEIKTNKGKERAKEELLENINSILVDGQITNIFFTTFIIQQG